MPSRDVELYLDLDGQPVPVGSLTVRGRGERTSSQFSYDVDFAYGGQGFDLAPSLPREDGYFAFRGLPLFVEDAGPDRWGAHLLRREALRSGPLAALDPFGNILGAADYSRQGAIRFAADATGGFIADGGVPVRMELSALLDAADAVVADDESFSPYARLLATGTSALGGARAKASVVGDDGRLMMAKFPMANDSINVPAWEKVTLDLARRAGIEVPDSQLLHVGARAVLLLDRFDRVGQMRVPYMTYRTLLNNRDDGSRPPDYTQIATALRTHTEADLGDLFRRTAFGVMVNNTDDHLRNMGLLRRNGYWVQAPMFDVNPEPEAGKERHTAIAGAYTLLRARDGLIELGPVCGLSQAQVSETIRELHDVVSAYEELAMGYGVPEFEAAKMVRVLAQVHGHLLPSTPRPVLPAAQAASTAPRRAKTTSKSNSGSFAPKLRGEDEVLPERL